MSTNCKAKQKEEQQPSFIKQYMCLSEVLCAHGRGCVCVCVLFGLLCCGPGVTAALLQLLLWQPVKNSENRGRDSVF